MRMVTQMDTIGLAVFPFYIKDWMVPTLNESWKKMSKFARYEQWSHYFKPFVKLRVLFIKSSGWILG